MPAETVEFAIVGCGGIARPLADAIESIEDVDLIACADLDEDRAEQLADEHAIPDWYTDHERLLEDASPDVTIVATPNGTHADITVDCAEAGVHVLCQKPLEITVDGLDRMEAACDEAGVKLAGLYNTRFGDGSQAAKRAVEEGHIGDVVLANGTLPAYRGEDYYRGWHGTRELDGGALFTQACHTIDRLAWINGGIERVFADVDTVAHDIETEDVATVSLRYGNGARGTITVTTASKGYPHYDRLDLHGAEGFLQASHEAVLASADADGEEIDVANPYDVDGFTIQVRDMAEAVREDRQPIVSGSEARHAPDAVLAMHESARRGVPVEVAAFTGRDSDE